MIVDELARWKASLLHTTECYEHHVRLALHEHSDLWSSLIEIYTIMSRLQLAFDPLLLSKKEDQPKAMSLLGN